MDGIEKSHAIQKFIVKIRRIKRLYDTKKITREEALAWLKAVDAEFEKFMEANK